MSENSSDAQVSEIRNAIRKVTAVGPDFLKNKVPAEEMAHTMVSAVDTYIRQAQQSNSLSPQGSEVEELQEVLGEIKGCGSGFLADRCDAACVARTITWLLEEFPKTTTA